MRTTIVPTSVLDRTLFRVELCQGALADGDGAFITLMLIVALLVLGSR